MRIAFHTLGCKVNHYETEAMREAFVSRGAVCVGEEDPADVYIINTCTVTNIADRKSRQYIRRVKRINPDAVVVVTGCYAQVEPEEVAAMPEVDMVIGNGQKSKICNMVFEWFKVKDEAAGGQAEASQAEAAGGQIGTGQDEAAGDQKSVEQNNAVGKQVPGRTIVSVMPREELTEYEDMGLVASSEPGMTRAYIKIQEGCDRFCSYCLIPFARGPVRSRPPQEILQEAEMLLDSGVREIVLTGINTALYGTEPGSDFGITDILAGLDAIDRDFRIRLSSLEPTVVDKDDVAKVIRYKKLCHHLHLSVQNGSDKILKAMNRHYTRDDYLEIVRAIRDFDPLYGITTDIIVGFPGEDEKDFEDTLDIVEKSEFGKVHVFRYSPRKGTVGEKLPDAVPGQVKNERSDWLEAASEKVAEQFKRNNFGVVHTVLAEEIQDGYVTGYTGNYIKVYIEVPAEGTAERVNFDKSARLGDFCRVELTQIFRDGCKAVLVE